MNKLIKLKINLSCLIRLTKIELYDSIDDLRRNIEMIKYYEQKNLVKYQGYINQLKLLNNIYVDSIINFNNELKNYYKELNDLNIFIDDKIDELQNNLEISISNLECNRLKIKKYDELIKDKSIVVTSSETNYLIKEVLNSYEILKQERNSYLLLKKYN